MVAGEGGAGLLVGQAAVAGGDLAGAAHVVEGGGQDQFVVRSRRDGVGGGLEGV
ncbi:hypothetical protein GCM10023334_072850 [Nonomuraea thailandensis]